MQYYEEVYLCMRGLCLCALICPEKETLPSSSETVMNFNGISFLFFKLSVWVMLDLHKAEVKGKKKLLFLHFTIKCFILKYRDIKTWVCLWLYASFQALELVIILCMTVLRFLREIGVQIYWSVSNDWFIGLIVPQRISPGIHLHLGASVKEADSWKNSDPRK